MPTLSATEPLTPQQTPALMVAGALAHLATHMDTGCPRAAYLAAMLLDQVATDSRANAHLREHARELVEILDRDYPGQPVQLSRRSRSVDVDRGH